MAPVPRALGILARTRDSRRRAYRGPARVVQRRSRERRFGSFCKSARGPRKPSANGCSLSVINQGLDSSMYARGHVSGLAGSIKKKAKAVPRLALAARGAMLGMQGARPANVQHAGATRSEQVWLVRLGSAPLRACVATGGVRGLHVWPLVSDVLVPAVLSREEHCSEVQCLLHIV